MRRVLERVGIMGNARMEEIEEQGKDAGKSGGGSFYYVDKDKAERDGLEMFKAGDGPNFITILPPEDPKQFYAREVFIHRDIGPRNLTFLCMRHTRTAKTSKQEAVEWNEPCAVCEKYDRTAAKNPDSEILKDLQPYRRFLFLLKDTSSLPADATEQEMEAANLPTNWYDGSARFRDCITKVSKDKRSGKYTVDVCDPDKGKTVCFDRSGKKKQTRYEAFQLEDRNPIPDSWLQSLPDFDTLLLRPEYEVVKTHVEGMVAKPVDEGRTRGRDRGGDSTRTRAADTTVEGDTTGGRAPRTRPGRDEAPVEETPAEQTTEQREHAEAQQQRQEVTETQEPATEQKPVTETKPPRTRDRTKTTKKADAPAEKVTVPADSEDDKIAAVRKKIADRKAGEEA